METSNSDDRCRLDGLGFNNPLHQQPSDAAPELLHHSSIPESIRNLLREEAQYHVDDRSLEDQKRVSYLSWDDYFMAIAFLSARRSKDPLTPTGACLVDEENRVVGIGYNGFPWGCPDDLLPWQSARASSTSSFPAIAVDDSEEKEDTSATQLPYLHTSSPFECRAELNAILNKCSATVAGARLYVPNFPCNESAKVIAQSRIRQVLYLRDDEHDSDSSRASRIILQMSGVETIHYIPTVRYIDLDLSVTNVPNSISKDDLIPSLSQPPPLCTQQNSELLDLLWREAQWVPSSSSSVRRHEVLSWEDYFMAMAFLTAKRSKDPNTQVGACVVSRQKIILALGYNGFPRGCSDDALPWARSSSSSSWLHTKYPYVCHAEVNAILNKGSASLEHSTIYVALFPCNECAKLIIQAGIEEVVYLQDIYHETDACRASRILLQMSGVKLRQYVPSVTKIRLDLGSPT